MNRFNFSNELLLAFNMALNLYRNDTNVFGIDIGYKYQNDIRTKELCVRVHLGHKEGYSSMNQLIDHIAYTNFGDQARRRVLPMNSQRTKRLQTLQPGISIGNSDTGTLGLFCFDRFSGAPCLLTAGHVVNNVIGSPVSQPGPWIDGGHLLFDAIANTLRFDHRGDAAIAKLNGRKRHQLEQFETSNVINEIRQVKLGDILTKSGRTTNLTTAIVDGIGVYFQASSNIRKEIQGFKLVPIDPKNINNIEISDNGDSGAIWFDTHSNEGVGLLFAGENSTVIAQQEFCLAQHLTDIFERLQISL